MKHNKIIGKIYRKLDGEMTPAARDELEKYLSSHPGFAPISGELELLNRQLDSEKGDQVEIDLKEEILKKINMESYKHPPVKEKPLFVQSFWSRPVTRYGFAFLAGVFTGFMIFTLIKADFKGSRTATDETKGVVYDSRSFENMKTADIIRYESSLAKAVCDFRYSPKVVELRLDISLTELVKAIINFNYSSFEVLNIVNVSMNEQTTAMAGSNVIHIDNIGDNKFIIRLANKTSLPNNIDFKIFQNDFPVYQNSVLVNKE